MKKIIILLLIPFILASCVLEVEDPNGLISQNVTNLTQNFNSSIVNNVVNQTTNITNNITNNITTDNTQIVYLTNDFFFSSTTLVNISNGTQLRFNFSSGEIYAFEVVLFGNFHATPDIRLRTDTQTKGIGKVSSYSIEQATDRLDDLDVTQATLSMATGNDHVGMKGVVEGISNGNLHIQIRQDIADINVQRIDKYSFIKWTKIN